MPSPLIQAGAAADPSKAAPLHTNRFFTGLWTQRSPLRDAATPYLYEKFYSASRFDSLIGGANSEITTRLTLARRPGHSVYNSAAFAYQRLANFRPFVNGIEQIHILADVGALGTSFTSGSVRDVTGGVSSLIWIKKPGSARSSFQPVGNTLYFCDGVSPTKWTLSTKAWAANTTFNAGDFIVDANNQIQLASVVNPISQATVSNQTSSNGSIYTLVEIIFAEPVSCPIGTYVGFSGLTHNTFLNGQTLVSGGQSQPGTNNPPNAYTAYFITDFAANYSGAETGSATFNGVGLSSGSSGATQPAFSDSLGGTVQDGAITWTCKGSAVTPIGFAGPANAPNVTSAVQATPVTWVQGAYYTPSLAIVDSNGNIQYSTSSGLTGSSQPTWATGVGQLTTDGLLTWENGGSATSQRSAAVAVGKLVSVAYNTVTGNATAPVTSYTSFFRCVQAGITGATAPTWGNGAGFGSQVYDGTAVWQNVGASQQWSAIGAQKIYDPSQYITDSNGYLQQVVNPGRAGTTQPIWAGAGGTSPDGGAGLSWLNTGTSTAAFTSPVYYAYAYKNSVTQHVSTASPRSVAFLRGTGAMGVVQGLTTSEDPQIDTVVVYRTAQGGSTLLELDEFPMPSGQSWTYFDSSSDSDLNVLIEAAIADTNDPPPANLTGLAYHLGRLWGFSGEYLVYSGGPDTLTGNGMEAWPPLNYFALPSRGVLLWPTSIGLIVFTESDVLVVLGSGTSSSALYCTMFQAGVGLLNADSFAVNGSTAYLMTTANRLVSFDPSAGETEVGFPIGDIFAESYTQAGTVLAYHEGSSADTALYAADGLVGWYRMSTISAPESGQVWSPQAQVVGGVQTLASIEITPGVKKLLVAPYPSGPLLIRDDTKNTDNGTPFVSTAQIGSIVLAQPGQIAGAHFITCDSTPTGTRPVVGVLLGEISGTFDLLYRTRQDPTTLPPSKSIWGDRYYMSQSQAPAWCRHMQVSFTWPAEDAANELLSYTIFGEIKNETEQG